MHCHGMPSTRHDSCGKARTFWCQPQRAGNAGWPWYFLAAAWQEQAENTILNFLRLRVSVSLCNVLQSALQPGFLDACTAETMTERCGGCRRREQCGDLPVGDGCLRCLPTSRILDFLRCLGFLGGLIESGSSWLFHDFHGCRLLSNEGFGEGQVHTPVCQATAP